MAKMLHAELQTNLAALAQALDPELDTSACKDLTTKAKRTNCTSLVAGAAQRAKNAGGEMAAVASGLESALGSLDEANLRGLQVSARIRFTIVAVDALIRATNSLERQVDDWIDEIDIGVPVVGGIVALGLRHVAAALVTSALDPIVAELEKHSLIHRAAMIRQACSRYSGDLNLGMLSARALKRLILSGSDSPSEFNRALCESMHFEDGETRYLACPALAVASKERKRVRAVLTKKLKEGSLDGSVSVDHGMPPPMAWSEPPGPTPRAAAIMRETARACDGLDTEEGCDLHAFNLIGSLAASYDPDGSDGTNVTAEELLPKFRQLKESMDHMNLAVSQLGNDLAENENQLRRATGAIVAVDQRVERVEFALEALAQQQGSFMRGIGRCDAKRREVRAERAKRFNRLAADNDLQSACSTRDRIVISALTDEAAMLFSRQELCDETLPVSATIWLSDGLFDTGKHALAASRRDVLTNVWNQLLSVAGDEKHWQVTGHVDSQGFQKAAEYEERQQELAFKRAEAVVELLAEARERSPKPFLTAERGSVPTQSRCRRDECARWRTVSISSPGFLPVLNPETCDWK